MAFSSSPCTIPKAVHKGSLHVELGPILSIMRPHNSETERNFIRSYLIPLGEHGHTVYHDRIGNVIINLPGPKNYPRILWSCHLDTVHRDEGKQKVSLFNYTGDDKTLYYGLDDDLKRKGWGHCLGGDDGVGVWILINMILGKVPGLYIFHRGEEKGCIGSRFIARDKDLQAAIKMSDCVAAIALDRKDTDNVITHQGGDQLASDDFARSINDAMDVTFWKPDPTGAFTDTRHYGDIIRECTNLSVGYKDNHSERETVNFTFAQTLLEGLLKFDATKLVIKRPVGGFPKPVYSYQPREPYAHRYRTGWYEGGMFHEYDDEYDKCDVATRDTATSAPPAQLQLPHCKEAAKALKLVAKNGKAIKRTDTYAARLTRFLNKYPRLMAEAIINADWTETDLQTMLYNVDGRMHTIDG